VRNAFLFLQVAESKPESDGNLKVEPPSIAVPGHCPLPQGAAANFRPWKKRKYRLTELTGAE
jgi:hypothetical protein